MANMFVNLHVHSQFSLLDSCLKIEDLVKRNKEITDAYNQKTGESHTAYSCITDHGNLFASVFHYNETQKYDIVQIIGEEFYVTDDMHNKNAEHYRNHKNEHMIILSKNMESYKRISKLSSLAATEGFYYKARIDDKCLEDVGTDGLIATSACVAGRIPVCLKNDDIEGARKWAAYYSKLFHGDFYLEIQPTEMEDQVKVNKGIIEIAKELGIPLVATTDAHYLDQSEKESHDVLLCMQSKDVMSNPDRWTYPGNTYYLMTKDEVLAAFNSNGHEELDQKAVLEAVENTEEIAKQCSTEFKSGVHYLSSVKIPEDNEKYNEWKKNTTVANNDDLERTKYLQYMYTHGLARKKAQTKADRVRMAHEMQVIKEMGFETYFILYGDLIKFIREEAKIPCGPGRGCFGPDNLVMTSKGFKRILNVNIGDYVYAKDEKLHKVTNKFIYNVNEEMFDLDFGDVLINKVTKDHKILVKKDNALKWVEADKLEVGDLVCCVDDVGKR